MGREILVGAAQNGDGVIFQRANGAIGIMSAVAVGRSELVFNVDDGHELFEGG